MSDVKYAKGAIVKHLIDDVAHSTSGQSIALEGILLFGCALTCLFSKAMVASIIALALAALALLLYAVYSLSFTIKYFPFILYSAMSVAGCAFCELNIVNLYELAAESFFVGSLPLLTFSRMLFIYILLLMDYNFVGEKDEHSLEPSNSLLLTIETIITIALIAAYLVFTIPLGSAASLGVDRFKYEQLIPFGSILTPLSNQFNILIIGPVMSLEHGKRKLGAVGIILYIIYLFWTGNKFGGFVFLISFIFLCIHPRVISLSDKASKKISLVMFGLVLALIAVAVGAQYAINRVSPIQYLENRLSQQGQLWWMTFQNTDGDSHINEIGNEIIGQINGTDAPEDNIGSNFGIFKVMYDGAPKDIVDAKLSRGSAYAEAGYAAMYYYLGPAGPVLYSVITAGITFLVVYYLVDSMRLGLVINAILLGRFLIMVHGSIGMFLFTDYFEWKTLLPLLYLVVVQSIRKIFPTSNVYKVLHHFALV